MIRFDGIQNLAVMVYGTSRHPIRGGSPSNKKKSSNGPSHVFFFSLLWHIVMKLTQVLDSERVGSEVKLCSGG